MPESQNSGDTTDSHCWAILGKQVPVAMNTHVTTVLFKMAFPSSPCQGYITRTTGTCYDKSVSGSSCTTSRAMRQKNMGTSPMGPGTKNDCWQGQAAIYVTEVSQS
jgi:hypothetical protein